MSHTIVLLQTTRNPNTRTYSDFETAGEALDGILKLYEAHLKARFPQRAHIDYDISELFAYIDALGDLSCLVFQKSTGQYLPHHKEWIKEQILGMLQRQAQRA
eukprot:m.30043 g.30043  ORF g.30043 m.30043 type:complete len:103 (+) comp10517_c0_seq1:310-618(+)